MIKLAADHASAPAELRIDLVSRVESIIATATSGRMLVLSYRKPDDESLELVRLGSHS